jgi:cytochrome c-type biogenesis protein CcmH
MAETLPPYLNALFWLIILLSLMGTAWWLLQASAHGERQEGDRSDLEVYADQVTEIDRDLIQGRISGVAAEAGRLEIGRRLVKARDRVLTAGPRANRLVLGVIAATVVVLAGGLYAVSGSPGRADLPFKARERELLTRDPATLTQDEILLLLQERARENPVDPQPHALMGQVLATAGRDANALRAYQAVLRRAPNDAEAIAEAAAILTRLNGGKVGADALAAFNEALKINPKSIAAQFYLGLVDWQAGRKDAAMSAWARAYQALADQPQSQELLAVRVAGAISQLDRGPDMGQSLGPIGQGISSTDQAVFITSMVESRVARLKSAPEDVALRLSVVRVLMMIGQNEAARKTLLEGVERAEDKSFTLALYGVTARGLASGTTSQQPTPASGR